jgi:hypothetical protein
MLCPWGVFYNDSYQGVAKAVRFLLEDPTRVEHILARAHRCRAAGQLFEQTKIRALARDSLVDEP